jgi:riboflavin synthase
MFTGIVGSGTIARIERSDDRIKLGLRAEDHYSECQLGDSVAVDGMCLTVEEKIEGELVFFVSSETIDKTIVRHYQTGRMVNVELPLRPNDRIGGHHVLGHVDCTTNVHSVDQSPGGWFVKIQVPEPFQRYLVYKGSVAVNGVSLTVNAVDGDLMELCIIPVTVQKTNFQTLVAGDEVNMEFDILAKYTERLLQK